jgi:hypothetical protein
MIGILTQSCFHCYCWTIYFTVLLSGSITQFPLFQLNSFLNTLQPRYGIAVDLTSASSLRIFEWLAALSVASLMVKGLAFLAIMIYVK